MVKLKLPDIKDWIQRYSVSALMVAYFCTGAIRLGLNNTLGYITGRDIIPAVCTFLCLALMAYCLWRAGKKKLLRVFFGTYLAVAVYFLVTLLLNPSYWTYYSRDVLGIWDELFCPNTGCLYAMLLIFLHDDPDSFLDDLGLCAWLNLAYYGVLCMLAQRRGYWEGYGASGMMVQKSYDLGVGYGLVFCATVFLTLFLRKRNWLNLAACGVACVYALQNGPRGAWVCLLSYLALCFVFLVNWEKRTGKAIAVRVGVLAVAAILFLCFYEPILSGVGNLLSSMGIRSRTVNALVSGTIFDDNGRDRIAQLAAKAYTDAGFFGQGAFGDRPYIAPYFWWGYSHNIFLEAFSNFGVIPGAAILLALFGACGYILVTCKDRRFLLVFILFLGNTGKLLISDTIWGYPVLWGLIGMIAVYFYGMQKRRIAEETPKERTMHVDCKVSVCCLAFNHEKYIRQALDSMINQKTDFAYEIIVMDDASTDGTQDIIREYMEKYPDKVRGVLQRENQYSKGVAIVNELFYPLARGQYIAYCEGDDYWTNGNKLQRQADFLDRHPEYVAHTHECWEVAEDGKTIAQYYFNGCYKEHYDLKLHTNWQILSGQTATVMHRKEAYDLAPEAVKPLGQLKITGDVKKTAILVLHGPIYHSGEMMSHHRRVYSGGDSWSAKTAKDNLRVFYFDALDELSDYVKKFYGRDMDYSGFQIKMTVTSLYLYILRPTREKLETLKYMYRHVKQYPNARMRLLWMFVRLPFVRMGIKLSRMKNSRNYRKTHKGE